MMNQQPQHLAYQNETPILWIAQTKPLARRLPEAEDGGGEEEEGVGVHILGQEKNRSQKKNPKRKPRVKRKRSILLGSIGARLSC
jgi:hypothetical protein